MSCCDYEELKEWFLILNAKMEKVIHDLSNMKFFFQFLQNLDMKDIFQFILKNKKAFFQCQALPNVIQMGNMVNKMRREAE